MELANFAQQNADPKRPSGTCEVGGHPARAAFDRSNPAQAKLTVQFGLEPGTPLPLEAVDCTQLQVRGTAVPVRVVNLPDGSEALRGLVDPALVDAVTGEGASRPAPAGQTAPGADAPGPGAPDPLVALSRQRAAAIQQRAAHAERCAGLRKEAADLRARLDAVETELANAGETAAAHAERCAEISQQIRDLLDAEETA